MRKLLRDRSLVDNDIYTGLLEQKHRQKESVHVFLRDLSLTLALKGFEGVAVLQKRAVVSGQNLFLTGL